MRGKKSPAAAATAAAERPRRPGVDGAVGAGRGVGAGPARAPGRFGDRGDCGAEDASAGAQWRVRRGRARRGRSRVREAPLSWREPNGRGVGAGRARGSATSLGAGASVQERGEERAARPWGGGEGRGSGGGRWALCAGGSAGTPRPRVHAARSRRQRRVPAAHVLHSWGVGTASLGMRREGE